MCPSSAQFVCDFSTLDMWPLLMAFQCKNIHAYINKKYFLLTRPDTGQLGSTNSYLQSKQNNVFMPLL